MDGIYFCIHTCGCVCCVKAEDGFCVAPFIFLSLFNRGEIVRYLGHERVAFVLAKWRLFGDEAMGIKVSRKYSSQEKLPLAAAWELGM